MPSIPPRIHIYAIRAVHTDMVKIGVSVNLHERLRHLQTGTGLALRIIIAIETGYAWDVEASLHAALDRKCVSGEWFIIPKDSLVRRIVSNAVNALEAKNEAATVMPIARAKRPVAPPVAREYTERGVDRDERIRELALQRDGDYWAFSANRIVRTVGGGRNEVLNRIKAIREHVQPAQFREEDGGTAPATYPVTKN